jgi:hypothetical protein
LNKIIETFFGLIRTQVFQKLTLIIIISIVSNAYAQPISFPGAEGYGKYATGGRGGKVIKVTNLNDNGPGSLRDAVNQKGARTVLFSISGTISLESNLEIQEGNLTIAGQTAPGDGICIKNYQTSISADNVIIRFIRFRLGDETKQEADALSIMRSKNIIIDHCSFSWGIDEVFSIYDNRNTTVQWCIISEALNDSYHSKGEHGYGGIWGGINASFYYNLFSHNSSRNPRFNGARTGTSADEEVVDFRNNVIYNWGINSSYGGENGNYNMVGNYYKSGSATKKNIENRIINPWQNGKWFVHDNFVEGFQEISEDNWSGGIHYDKGEVESLRINSPVGKAIFKSIDSKKSYKKVLKFSGAILPKRDPVDQRIINETKNGTVHSGNGIINSQKEVGGWPELKSESPPLDTDNDGMPDEWELQNGLDPNNPSDRNSINEKGYTFLEVYLNELAAIEYSINDNYNKQTID